MGLCSLGSTPTKLVGKTEGEVNVVSPLPHPHLHMCFFFFLGLMIVHVYLHGFLYSISQPGSQLMRCSRQGRVSQPHLPPRNSCAFLTKASKESQGKGLPPGEDKHTLSFTNQNVTGKAKQLL